MSAVSKSVVQLGGSQSPALGLGPSGGGQSLLGGGGQPVMGYLGMVQHPAERIDRGATWSDPEVEQLLNIWTDENVQAELKEATIKKHIFERIARNLREKGFFRTAEQCREKIKRLKKEYRQAKNNNYRCVRGRATVKFFPRLQAVLDHSLDGLRPTLRSYYDGGPTDYGAADSPSSAVQAFTLGIKASPRSFSDCSAEEIKVDVNPAELDNDVYMGGGSDIGPGDPSADEGPSPSGGKGSERGDRGGQPHPAHYNSNHHNHHHHPQQQRGSRGPSPAAAPRAPPAHHPRPPSYNHHQSHPTLMHPLASLQHPISISIPLAHNHHNSVGSGGSHHLNSRHANHHSSSHSAPSGHSLSHGHNSSGNNNGGNGIAMLRPLASAPAPATDDPECVSEGSSVCSRVSTPAPLSPPLLRSRSSSPHHHHQQQDQQHHSSSRKRKLKRGRAIRTHAFRETLDLTLDRFLQHQRESEERLFAWEERRIQMELEAEERWRQEDRAMLRQLVAQLSIPPPNSNSEPSPAASSGSRSNSSHEH